ncbi:putative O-acyltransferase [Cocos nucifera]|uniref:diacylglycerol O-acyltransferase n=1 Tax=Cocos nucifera TaxID=13894 RepID=A0A8K0MW11_COCNU|nr:putative O-acyltransferase [Cocos nucifera]
MCCLTLPAFPLGAFMVEKLAQHKFISEPVVISLHVIITTAEILYPVIVILRCDSAVLSGIALMLFASVVWLKLVSYAHTNYDMRKLSKSIDKEDMYSNCPEIGNLKGVSFKSLAYFMVAPTLCYQLKALEGNQTVKNPTSKSRLNILAELLCFGDREFYKDWWNAKTIEEVGSNVNSFELSFLYDAICLINIVSLKCGFVEDNLLTIDETPIVCSLSIDG